MSSHATEENSTLCIFQSLTMFNFYVFRLREEWGERILNLIVYFLVADTVYIEELYTKI